MTAEQSLIISLVGLWTQGCKIAVYPLDEGGIRLEWDVGQNYVSLNIDKDSKSAYLHCLNRKTDFDFDATLDLDTEHETLKSIIQSINDQDKYDEVILSKLNWD